jgi:RimJ/RimL family protein N-acetyltransferase
MDISPSFTSAERPLGSGSIQGASAVQLLDSTILADSFFLSTAQHADIDAVSKFIGKKGFFFAPLSDLKREGATDFIAASFVMFGDPRTERKFTLAVRARDDEDTILGCISFAAPKDRPAISEISYFFDPTHFRRTLGSQSVLRAMHWLVNEGGYQKLKIRRLKATVDPENTASIKILHRAGLEVTKRGFTLPEESPYRDKQGRPRPRLLLEGNVPTDIIPSLQKALTEQRYSLQTLVSAAL